jgi:hypothetical protein
MLEDLLVKISVVGMFICAWLIYVITNKESFLL